MKKITLLFAALFIVFAASAKTLYLTPNSNWKQSNARFAAYFFGNGDKWVSMTKVAGETDLYEVEVPSGYPSVIFCRMNPSASANNWNNKWNQTSDLTVPTNAQNHYTVKEGTWDKGGGTWTVYAPEAPKTYKDITITITANAQPKIHYWEGGDKMVGSDWESKPDMIATAEANTYSYTIKDVDEAIGVKYLIVVGEVQSVDLHTIDNVTANFKDCLPQVAVMGVRNWDGTDKMVVADDYKTASITLNLTVKDYAWKLTVNGEWFGGSKYVITRDKNSLNVTDDAGGDGKLTADIAGEYVFTYTYATKNLTVIYPSNSVEPDPEPTTYAVKFDNTNSGWEKVYAYCWNGEGESVVANAEWPGVELTNPENNVYTYSTTTAYENVIFNAGAEKPQTANLVFENGKTYSIDVAYVLGTVNYERIANNECWSVDFAEHKMTYDANTGIWTKTYTNLPAGDYEFKLYCGDWLNSVVVDSVNSTPGFKYDNLGDNISFTLSEASTVTITYNAMLNTFAIVGQGIDKFGELVVTSYTLCGSKAIFGGEKDFDETLTANDMTEQDGVWTKTYEAVQLEAYNEEAEEGVTYEYKVAANHAWNGAAYPSADVRVVLWVAEAGKYNLTFTYNPNAEGFKLNHVVEKVAAEPTTYTLAGDAKIFGTGWCTDCTENDLTEGEDGVWTKTYTVQLEAGDYEYKVVANYAWGNGEFPVQGNEKITITEAGTYNLIFTYIPGETLACQANLLVAPAAPVISIEKGVVTFSCETEGAKIMYAFVEKGGELTDAMYQGYTGEISMSNGDYTVYAYAEKDGLKSEVVSMRLKIDNGVAVDAEVVTIAEIFVQNRTIVTDGEFQIFTVTGQNVTDMNGALANGVYVVRTANAVAKVVVR